MDTHIMFLCFIAGCCTAALGGTFIYLILTTKKDIDDHAAQKERLALRKKREDIFLQKTFPQIIDWGNRF